MKVALCEGAEALVLSLPSSRAFHKLQKLHDEWRETGPVANEYKEALWGAFRSVEPYQQTASGAFRNAEGASRRRTSNSRPGCASPRRNFRPAAHLTRKEWNRASDRLLEIQKTWKTISFAAEER